MIHEVTGNYDIKVTAGDTRISVAIGNGQVGGSAMFLNGQPVGPIGVISDYRIGDGVSLVGSKLLVRTLVADVSDVTNWTSVVYLVSAPNPQEPISATKEVANDKEAVRYNFTFRFVH